MSNAVHVIDSIIGSPVLATLQLQTTYSIYTGYTAVSNGCTPLTRSLPASELHCVSQHHILSQDLLLLQRAVQKVMKRSLSDAPLQIVFTLFDANHDGNLAATELVTVSASILVLLIDALHPSLMWEVTVSTSLVISLLGFVEGLVLVFRTFGQG